jgi:SHS2 domain-containing protein
MSVIEGYEHFEVEADVGVRAWAPTLAAAFAQTALGVFALVVPPEDVTVRETREVRAQGEGLETLLVSWINECLYVHEIEGFAVHQVIVTSEPGAFVHGELHGEPIDSERHRLGTVVKAATLHGVAVISSPGHHETRLVVDV